MLLILGLFIIKFSYNVRLNRYFFNNVAYALRYLQNQITVIYLSTEAIYNICERYLCAKGFWSSFHQKYGVCLPLKRRLSVQTLCPLFTKRLWSSEISWWCILMSPVAKTSKLYCSAILLFSPTERVLVYYFP